MLAVMDIEVLKYDKFIPLPCDFQKLLKARVQTFKSHYPFCLRSRKIKQNRMVSKIVVIIFGMSLAASVSAYSAGAPTDACDTMKPEHGVDPKDTEIRYNFQVSRKAIRSGDEVDLTVTGKAADDKIRGFMIQMRQKGKRVGQFAVNPSDPFVQGLDCDGVKNSAVTHKKHEEKDDRRSLTVTWVSPKNFKGEVVFNNTIALNGGEFWVGHLSDTVKVY